MAETRPVYNDQGEVVDFQVISHRQGNAHLNTQDYIEQSDGSFKHIYQDVSLVSDKQDVSSMNFQMSSYQQALVEAMPELPAAIQWVENSPDFTVEELEEYNQALDNNDLDAINRFYERLLPLYRQALAEQQQPQQSPDDADDEEYNKGNDQIEEWFDELPDEFIDATVDELYETDFDSSKVQIMDSLSTQYEPNSAHFEILQAGQQIANGSMTVDDAIDQITSEFGEAVAAAAYIELQHMITNYYG